MKTEQIKAKEVVLGNRIMGIDGKPVSITEIAAGMPRNTIELRWAKGWQAVSPKTILERVVA